MTDDQAPKKPGELVRCRGPKCPTPGGRILFRVHRGVVYIEARLRAGEEIKAAVYGMPISVNCPACKHPWINPDAVASDGVGGLIERTIKDILAADHDEPAA